MVINIKVKKRKIPPEKARVFLTPHLLQLALKILKSPINTLTVKSPECVFDNVGEIVRRLEENGFLPKSGWSGFWCPKTAVTPITLAEGFRADAVSLASW